MQKSPSVEPHRRQIHAWPFPEAVLWFSKPLIQARFPAHRAKMLFHLQIRVKAGSARMDGAPGVLRLATRIVGQVRASRQIAPSSCSRRNG
jgi:hypothetical protein